MDLHRVTLAVTVAIAIGPALAGAQGLGSVSTISDHGVEGIPVGPFLFSPAAQVGWVYRDNVFFKDDAAFGDSIYEAGLRLSFELPVRESSLTFDYQPTYREFADTDFGENLSHLVRSELSLDFPTGLVLGYDYRFLRGAFETGAVDPGGEFVFTGNSFDRHDVNLRASYWLTSRDGFSVNGGYEELDYEESGFFSYKRDQYGVGWLHQVNDLLVMNVTYSHSVFDADSDLDYRDYSSDAVTVGFRGSITPTLSSTVDIGWRRTDHDWIPSDEDGGAFSGFVANGHLDLELAHGSKLRLNVRRSEFPSNYADVAYYVSTGAGLSYSLSFGRLGGMLEARFQRNDYDYDDTTQQSRQDDLLTLSAGINTQFTEMVSLSARYTTQDRDSMTSLSYATDTVSVFLRWGF